MNRCSKCGGTMNENAKYCKACGSGTSMAPLDRKKARVMGQEKTWVKPVVIAAVIVAMVGALWLAKGIYLSKKMGSHPLFPPHRDVAARLARAVPVKEQRGQVNIPIKTFDDGNAHFFAFASGGKTITFFVMKAMGGSIHTAFDACMACNHAKLGYRQEGSLVVCNNCGMGFNPMEIGNVSGGCNPIPLNKSVDGQMLVLKTRDLEAGAQYF